MNSYNTDIFFSNYYHLQSVRFELVICLTSQLQNYPLKSKYNDPLWTLSKATSSLEKKYLHLSCYRQWKLLMRLSMYDQFLQAATQTISLLRFSRVFWRYKCYICYNQFNYEVVQASERLQFLYNFKKNYVLSILALCAINLCRRPHKRCLYFVVL